MMRRGEKEGGKEDREELGAGLFLKWKKLMFVQINVGKEPGK